MAGIGIVFNPHCRRHRRDPGAALRLARVLGHRGVLREAHSTDELERIANDFKSVGIDTLAISGGDGTNHVTITHFLKVYEERPLPPIALLRGGTMNTVANAVGSPKACPEALLHRLVTRSSKRPWSVEDRVERHTLQVGSHHGFLFGTGVVRGFLSEYYRHGPPTAAVAVRTLARGIVSTLTGGEMARRMTAPFRGSVELENGLVWPERDYLSVAAGTIDQIGLRFRPFPRFAERADAFHMLGIHASAGAFVMDLPRIARGQSMHDDNTYESVSRRAVLRSATGTVQYMIDGDLYESNGPLTLTAGPIIRFICRY